MDSKKPIIQKRDRTNSVSIFEDQYVNSNGEAKKRYSVAIQRSYKDKDGNWKNLSLSCFIEDLLPLASLMENAYIAHVDYMNRSKNNQSSQSSVDDDIPF